MLFESLAKETLQFQGFRVMAAQKTERILETELTPDRRYAPRCGARGVPVHYRDTHSFRKKGPFKKSRREKIPPAP